MDKQPLIQHSVVPYVVKNEKHGLDEQNTIVVPNDKGVIQKIKKVWMKRKNK